MTKKCLGCGLVLQTTDKEKLGYTPNSDNKLCMRCFKLKHYGELINKGKIQDNKKLINKINKYNYYVIYLVDFINIYSDIMDTYKNINNRKCLVVTKSDLIPKNIIKNKLKDNIKRVYNIEEDVIFVSTKDKENINVIRDIIDKKDNVIICGYTNMGKSSLINTLSNSDITVSKCSNTTQEFITIGGLIDAPGFINEYRSEVLSKRIRPITYQIKSKYYLKIDDIVLAFNNDNNITLYLDNGLDISKRRKREEFNYSIMIPKDSDLVIKGLGFIKFKSASQIFINTTNYEIRPSIVGGFHED